MGNRTAAEIAALYPELDKPPYSYSLRVKQRNGEWAVLEDNLKYSVARVLYNVKRKPGFDGKLWVVGMFEKEKLIAEHEA